MAISYVSSVVSSNPYILPFDLNLMYKVNSIKQQQFYANAQRVGENLNNIKNLDILNEDAKNRANNAYSKVVNQLTSYGAIDYSDMNIASQLSNLGSEIYNDPYTIRHIGETKKARDIINYYNKIKEDPKNLKYYSSTNEAFDLQNIGEYVKGGIEASFTQPLGMSGPTKFVDTAIVNKELSNAASKLKADVQTTVNRDGTTVMFSTSENSYITPSRYKELFNSYLSADVRNQLMVEGWNKYRGHSEKDLADIEEENINLNKKLTDNKIDYLKNKLTISPEQKLETEKQLTIEKENKQNLENWKKDAFIKELELNKDRKIYAMGQLYINEKADQFGNAYGYNQEKIKYQTDQGVLQSLKHQNAMELAKFKSSLKGENGNGTGQEPLPSEGTLADNASSDTDKDGVIDVFSNIQTTINTYNQKTNNALEDLLIDAIGRRDDVPNVDVLLKTMRDLNVNNEGHLDAGDGKFTKSVLSLADVKLAINNPNFKSIQGLLKDIVSDYEDIYSKGKSIPTNRQYSMEKMSEFYNTNTLTNSLYKHVTDRLNKAKEKVIQNDINNYNSKQEKDKVLNVEDKKIIKDIILNGNDDIDEKYGNILKSMGYTLDKKDRYWTDSDEVAHKDGYIYILDKYSKSFAKKLNEDNDLKNFYNVVNNKYWFPVGKLKNIENVKNNIKSSKFVSQLNDDKKYVELDLSNVKTEDIEIIAIRQANKKDKVIENINRDKTNTSGDHVIKFNYKVGKDVKTGFALVDENIASKFGVDSKYDADFEDLGKNQGYSYRKILTLKDNTQIPIQITLTPNSPSIRIKSGDKITYINKMLLENNNSQPFVQYKTAYNWINTLLSNSNKNFSSFNDFYNTFHQTN